MIPANTPEKAVTATPPAWTPAASRADLVPFRPRKSDEAKNANITSKGDANTSGMQDLARGLARAGMPRAQVPLYCDLAWRCGKDFAFRPKIATMAEDWGINRHALGQHIREWAERGYLRRRQTHSGPGGQSLFAFPCFPDLRKLVEANRHEHKAKGSKRADAFQKARNRMVGNSAQLDGGKNLPTRWQEIPTDSKGTRKGTRKGSHKGAAKTLPVPTKTPPHVAKKPDRKTKIDAGVLMAAWIDGCKKRDSLPDRPMAAGQFKQHLDKGDRGDQILERITDWFRQDGRPDYKFGGFMVACGWATSASGKTRPSRHTKPAAIAIPDADLPHHHDFSKGASA